MLDGQKDMDVRVGLEGETLAGEIGQILLNERWPMPRLCALLEQCFR